MKHEQAIESEERTTTGELYEIRFHKEGLWYKAFEWSAYLYLNYMPRILETDKRILKPLKSASKKHTDGSIVIIGAPTNSIKCFLPDLDSSKVASDADIVYDLSKHRDIVDEINRHVTLDNYKAILSNWKNEQPFTNTSKGKEKKNTGEKGSDEYVGIIEQILMYPLENKTPIENTQFLASLKQELISLQTSNIYGI